MAGSGKSRQTVVAALLFSGYLGYGQIEPWLDRQRAITEASARIVAQQTVLAHYEAVSAVINTALRTGLASDSSLDRIRVAFMQTPGNRDNLPLLRWDITHSLTKPGHTVGALATDLHVSDWSDYFEQFLAHKCGRVNNAAVSSETTMARITEMHLAGFLVCPIYSRRGELVGAVFGSWDIGSPEPPDLNATEEVVRQVADKIGTAVPLGG
jgi:hypothetical protein